MTLSGGSAHAVVGLGVAYAKAGKVREARRILAELSALSRQRYVSPYLFVSIHSELGEIDEACALLTKAYENRDQFLVLLKIDSSLDKLRPDARFQDLVRRVGLPH